MSEFQNLLGVCEPHMYQIYTGNDQWSTDDTVSVGTTSVDSEMKSGTITAER